MPDLDRSRHECVRSGPSSELGEPELVRRAQLGSSAAFDQLVLRCGPDIYRFLLVRLRNESDARDALQETMAALWQMPPTISSVYRTNIARTMPVEFVLEHVCPAPV